MRRRANNKTGRKKKETLAVEAWCEHEFYIWRCFSGRYGTNNDKTILAFYPLFIDVLSGAFNIFLPMSYTFHFGAWRR